MTDGLEIFLSLLKKNPVSDGEYSVNASSGIRCVMSSGSPGSPEGVSGEGDGGQAEADGDHQRHTEPAALSHAEGEGRVQPGAGRAAGERSAR